LRLEKNKPIIGQLALYSVFLLVTKIAFFLVNKSYDKLEETEVTKLTLTTGILLIALGIVGYCGSGAQSMTALIPAGFGIIIGILGILSKKENIHKHMIHGALLIALLGLIGSFSGIFKTFDLLRNIAVERPTAAIAQAIMALICLIYLIAGIQSFIIARRQK
jgi:hypothetical protein